MIDGSTMIEIMNDIRSEGAPQRSTLTPTEEMLSWRAEVARDWHAFKAQHELPD